MKPQFQDLDVLCVGVAAYDLVFTLDAHLPEDAKMDAASLVRCGGGPAANAAVTISRLGRRAAFAGYLGRDPFGEENLRELAEAGVRTDLVVRGVSPTPLSAVCVKPDGNRALVNYRDPEGHLPMDAIDLAQVDPRLVLFDGHEPVISPALALAAQRRGIPNVLDAGSVRPGTAELVGRCDHLVCALKFALEYTGAGDEEEALERLTGLAPTVVITLGDRGLIWSKGQSRGRQRAFAVEAVDTTGAGDTFHGAYAVAILEEMKWDETLRFASAAAALCCMQIGARLGIPSKVEIETFLAAGPSMKEYPPPTNSG